MVRLGPHEQIYVRAPRQADPDKTKQDSLLFAVRPPLFLGSCQARCVGRYDTPREHKRCEMMARGYKVLRTSLICSRCRARTPACNTSCWHSGATVRRAAQKRGQFLQWHAPATLPYATLLLLRMAHSSLGSWSANLDAAAWDAELKTNRMLLGATRDPSALLVVVPY